MGTPNITIPYPHRTLALSALDLVGFTKIVTSGGELYGEVRGDGRWEVLRSLAAPEGSIYGIASLDKACPPEHYRYTLAVKSRSGAVTGEPSAGSLFAFHIKPSRWVAFTLEHFGRQYGEFWQADPYKLIQALGYSFNTVLGLHLDVYPPSYLTDDDAMGFWMPVKGA